MREDDDTLLDSAFADLRANETPPSAAFLERVIADAADAMPDQPSMVAEVHNPPWYAALFAGLGGWRGGAALTASAAFGLAIGLSGLADTLPGSAMTFSGEAAFLDGYSGLFEEDLGEG